MTYVSVKLFVSIWKIEVIEIFYKLKKKKKLWNNLACPS